ncbi:MAG: hypothetical protein JWR60_3371, partial [Polaromonas sp.]|nr:hypothetical protein [Polaromonas sp.]
MTIRLSSTLPAVLALLAAPLWLAQASAQTSAPAQPAVFAAAPAAAPPGYRSAFEGYRPYTDEKTVNWKEANDTAARIGGWREYAREA